MHRALLTLGLVTLAAPAYGQRDTADAVSQIRTYLTRLEGFGFSGIVLVAKGDTVLTQSAHGLADRRSETRMRTDHIFDVGSITKQFTAAAVLALESDGKLRITDSIGRYLREVPADKRGVTLHHLLTHTSGLVMGFGGDYEKLSRDELVRRAMTSTLRTPPGERHAYSNAGYGLLAAIVEIVSGTTYDNFVRDRLFRPAQMTSSGYPSSAETAQRVVRAYEGETDIGMAERAAATGGAMWNLIGNGGLHSTVGDLHRWMRALQRGMVLPAPAREKFFAPHVLVTSNYQRTNTRLHYAYGWYVWNHPSGKTVIFHYGGNGVMNAALRFHVEDSAFVITGSNVSEFHEPNHPVPAIERILAGETVTMPPPIIELPSRQLASFAGRYVSDDGAVLDVAAKARFLEVSGEGQQAFSFITGGRWLTAEREDSLNDRTATAVEASRKREFDALAKLFPSRVTATELADFETTFWKKRHDAHGAYVKTRILGTVPSLSTRFIGTTFVAIDFQRGTTYREYLWTPERTIGDLGPLDAPPATRHFPESATCVVGYTPSTARISRICFERSSTGVSAIVNDGERVVRLKKS